MTPVLVAAWLVAQATDVSGYAALVRVYRTGRGQEATSQLAGWRRTDVSNAARAAAETFSPADCMIAATLHAEVANVIVDARPLDAAFHIETGLTLVRAAGAAPFGAGRGDVTPRRWFHFVASMLVSDARFTDAAWIIQQGLLVFPRDPLLYFVRGTIPEMTIQTSRRFTGLRGPLPESPDLRGGFEQLAKRAIGDYEHALNVDPHLAIAALHIGWLRLWLADGRARQPLQAAIADADSDDVRYLGHLFLGGLEEHEKHLDAALREYQAAFATGAGYQAGCVALSHAEHNAGHGTRARELSAQCARLASHGDPWWDYRVKFDRDALDRLRAEARRP